ncbi:MAG: right-handed parallel beta-helix repeat-containing protein, partial [Planctomycetota bacterium]
MPKSILSDVAARRKRSLLFERLDHRCLLAALLPGHHDIPDFVASPTVSSVQSGGWNDPQTWSGNRVPTTDDLVRVSHGHTVRLVSQAADVSAIGVHGDLEIATEVRVDNVIVYHHGHLSMLPGTEMIFADGQLDLANDPLQWGQALIVQGEWTATGEEKTPYVRATGDIPVGATSFVADQIPTNWQVGDTLVLPETAQSSLSRTGGLLEQSETVKIAGIDGNRIHFDQPAKFPHHGISPNPFGVQRFAHVANLTRSITLRSENPSGLRAHTVVTHHADVDLENVAFVGLGRTSAHRPVNDSVINDTTTHIGTNPAGRYPFHAHHLHGSLSLTGSVVEDGEKWGITIHRTNDAVVENNVVYDTDGAGIATEDATEVGNVFAGNLVIKVDGGHQFRDLRAGARQTGGVPLGTPEVELGADGSGFWFRGPANVVRDNFVYDANGYGYNYNGYYQEDGQTRQVQEFRDN